MAELNDAEPTLVINALNEVLNGSDAVEEWKFRSRLGVSRQEAFPLLERLRGDGPS
jgi:hypothetical protein